MEREDADYGHSFSVWVCVHERTLVNIHGTPPTSTSPAANFKSRQMVAQWTKMTAQTAQPDVAQAPAVW